MKECKNSGILPCSEETAQGLIEALRKLREASELEEASNRLTEHIFEDILKSIKSDDMEKKTKKMTKAEAFEYLKRKRVVCDNFNGVAIQHKFFEVGIKWRGGSTEATKDRGHFLFVDLNGCLTHCNSREWFDTHEYEEISADDILSIEIIEKKKKSEEEEALDKISCLGAQIVDILLHMKGHHHVTITETTVALHDEGVCLFHSDPF